MVGVMTAWRKRGRPPLDRPSIDHGTPELQARRRTLAGGADPALSEHPLGVMLARGLISAEQHEAGCYYALLYRRAVAHPDLSVASLYRQLMGEAGGGGAIDEESLVRFAGLYRLGKNRLLAAGRRITAATENLVVFGRPARFLGRPSNMTPKRGPDHAELQAVLDGLSVLVSCYGRGARRRGRMEAHRPPSLAPRTKGIDKSGI